MTANHSSASDGYYTRVTDSEEERVLMLNWGEYLVHAAGENGALRALTYYENIGWISNEVLQTMTEYVSDIAEDDDLDAETLPPEGELLERLEGTPFELHAGSLQYISQLAGDDVDKHVRNLYTTEDRIEKHRSEE